VPLVVVPGHMGALHPLEQLLTLLLAFGPFLVLGGVIWWRRRNEQDDQARNDQPELDQPEIDQPER
jgi:uncharacterized iron-regulated membrane protein